MLRRTGLEERTTAVESRLNKISDRLGNQRSQLDNQRTMLEKQRARLDRQQERLERQLARMREESERLTELAARVKTLTSVHTVLEHQMGSMETRLERLLNAGEEVTSTEPERAEARQLLDAVREEHSRIRARFGVMTRYEERIRRLEAALEAQLQANQMPQPRTVGKAQQAGQTDLAEQQQVDAESGAEAEG
jgi:chromosome segregation ATPase